MERVLELRGKVSDKFIVKLMREDRSVINRFFELVDKGIETHERIIDLIQHTEGRVYRKETKHRDDNLDVSEWNIDELMDEFSDIGASIVLGNEYMSNRDYTKIEDCLKFEERVCEFVECREHAETLTGQEKEIFTEYLEELRKELEYEYGAIID